MFGFLEKADSALLYLGLSGIVRHAVYYYWRDRRPAEAELVGHVTDLMLYPLKSARGIRVGQVQCVPETGLYQGPIRDRHWMVATSDYHMTSARQKPALITIETRFDGENLILSALGNRDLSIDLTKVEKLKKIVNTEVHTTPTQALDCGDAAAEWISGFLQSPGGYRILYCDPNLLRRKVNSANKTYTPWTKIAKEEDKLAFHDSISVHLGTEESISDLNTHLPRQVSLQSMRPNVFVSTGAAPFDEDTWKDVYIGSARLKTIKLCSRCVLTTVLPDKGIMDENEQPLRALKGYRSIVKGLGPAFGIDLVVERPGTIKIGDPIYAVRGDNISRP